MKAYLGILIFFFGALTLAAQPVPEHLSYLTGCFKVSYRYIEDGTHDANIERSIEWITREEKNGTYSFQHYGIVDSDVIKHWREEWVETKPSSWQQRVLAPNGVFRYLCEGTLQFNQLRCTSPGAPKPLRDVDRKDYSKLDRETILQFTPKGWAQTEINTKINQAGKAVAKEVGLNEYKRVDDKLCDEAKKIAPQE